MMHQQYREIDVLIAHNCKNDMQHSFLTGFFKLWDIISDEQKCKVYLDIKIFRSPATIIHIIQVNTLANYYLLVYCKLKHFKQSM